MTLPRLLVPFLVVTLHAGPGRADNIWSQTVTPTGKATYAAADVLASLAPRPSLPRPVVYPAAPDFNRWSGGPGRVANTAGFPFCGAFGLRIGGSGGSGPGFAFGF